MASTQEILSAFNQDTNKSNGKQYLEKALKINDQDHDAWLDFAILFKKERKAASAIVCLKKAVEADPTDAISWTDMGRLAFAIKDAKNAAQFYSEAIKLDEMNADLYLARKSCYQMLGRPDLANEDTLTIQELKVNAKGGKKAGAEMPDDEAYEDD